MEEVFTPGSDLAAHKELLVDVDEGCPVRKDRGGRSARFSAEFSRGLPQALRG
jgi:hypothetical protein